MAKPSLPKPKLSKSVAVFSLSVKQWGLEEILGAAYLMTDRAYVALSGDRKKLIGVSLKPKAGATAKAAAEAFALELSTQKTRWAIARANQPIREFVAEQAVLLVNGQLPPEPSSDPAHAGQEPAADQLTDAQRSEIERLIAEVEQEIKTMNQAKAPSTADPKNIKASWEEKQAAEKKT